MYVILVNEDNSLYGSHKERIMKGSKLVDNLVFLVGMAPLYNQLHQTRLLTPDFLYTGFDFFGKDLYKLLGWLN